MEELRLIRVRSRTTLPRLEAVDINCGHVISSIIIIIVIITMISPKLPLPWSIRQAVLQVRFNHDHLITSSKDLSVLVWNIVHVRFTVISDQF